MENYFFSFCAPTLAGKKVANLFSYQEKKGPGSLERELNHWKTAFAPHGLKLYLLRKGEDRSLIYLYREKDLEKLFVEKSCQSFLQELNYPVHDLEACLAHLKERINQREGFPHEIGIFLGYPLEDVKQFIHHGGSCYKLAGPWKVYGDVGAARRTFEEYRFCSRYFICRQEQGHCIFDTMISFKEESTYEQSSNRLLVRNREY